MAAELGASGVGALLVYQPGEPRAQLAVPLQREQRAPVGPRHPRVHRPAPQRHRPAHPRARAGARDRRGLRRLLVLGRPSAYDLWADL